jgi:pyruvate/oxaloacetate carboxyltransferase/biotin carboxyl carrier protein
MPKRETFDDTLDNLSNDIEVLLKAPVGSRRVKITDLTPREGQQTKLATRVATEDLIPLCEALDKCGFYAVEMWGGATFDTCIRYLKEDPWERLRTIKAIMPNTKLQMLLRGQHILAYSPNSDKAVHRFVERAVANGMNVFRIFEATNDFRNLQVAVDAVRECGPEAESHIEVNYTISPVHTYERWMDYAEQLIEMGADWLSFKDATGILMPMDSYRLIKGIKERAGDKLPVLLHCHDMGGTSIANHFMAVLAGVDMIDSAMSPLAFGSSHPATESMVAMLRNTPFDSGIDLKSLEEPARIASEIRDKYEKYATKYSDVSGEVLIHKIPGGMIANMVANLEEAGKPELMDEALKEVPSVEADLGYPPLLTPLSQIVGVQATLNVITGERYKIVTSETRDYVEGKYGIPPGPINKELIQKIMGDEEPDYSIRAGDLADQEDWDKAVETLGPLAKSDEDILMGVMFPMQTKELLELKESGELAAAHAAAIPSGPQEPAEASAEAPAKPAEAPAEAPAQAPAAGPPAPPPPTGAVLPTVLPAPVEFDAVLDGKTFHVQVAGVGEPPVPGAPVRYFVKIDDRLEEVEVRPQPDIAPVEFDEVFQGDKFHVQVAGVGEPSKQGAPRSYFIRVDGKLEEIEVHPQVEIPPSALLASSARAAPAAAPAPATEGSNPPSPAVAEAPAAEAPAKAIPKATQPGDAVSPMAGRVVRVLVKAGDTVKAGQTVVVVEAMKLESEVQSPIEGVVEEIFVEPGDSVTSEDALVRVA